MTKRYKLSESQVAALPKMRAAGLTYAEIGDLLGISKETVHRYFGLSRRQCTYYCELCEKPRKDWLHYHHWDDDAPEYGLWLCPSCHKFAEVVESFGDQDVRAKYLVLKEKAIQQVDSRPTQRSLTIPGRADV